MRARAMMAWPPKRCADDPLPPVPGFTRFVRHEPVVSRARHQRLEN